MGMGIANGEGKKQQELLALAVTASANCQNFRKVRTPGRQKNSVSVKVLEYTQKQVSTV